MVRGGVVKEKESEIRRSARGRITKKTFGADQDKERISRIIEAKAKYSEMSRARATSSKSMIKPPSAVAFGMKTVRPGPRAPPLPPAMVQPPHRQMAGPGSSGSSTSSGVPQTSVSTSEAPVNHVPSTSAVTITSISNVTRTIPSATVQAPITSRAPMHSSIRMKPSTSDVDDFVACHESLDLIKNNRPLPATGRMSSISGQGFRKFPVARPSLVPLGINPFDKNCSEADKKRFMNYIGDIAPRTPGRPATRGPASAFSTPLDRTGQKSKVRFFVDDAIKETRESGGSDIANPVDVVARTPRVEYDRDRRDGNAATHSILKKRGATREKSPSNPGPSYSSQPQRSRFLLPSAFHEDPFAVATKTPSGRSEADRLLECGWRSVVGKRLDLSGGEGQNKNVINATAFLEYWRKLSPVEKEAQPMDVLKDLLRELQSELDSRELETETTPTPNADVGELKPLLEAVEEEQDQDAEDSMPILDPEQTPLKSAKAVMLKREEEWPHVQEPTLSVSMRKSALELEFEELLEEEEEIEEEEEDEYEGLSIAPPRGIAVLRTVLQTPVNVSSSTSTTSVMQKTPLSRKNLDSDEEEDPEFNVPSLSSTNVPPRRLSRRPVATKRWSPSPAAGQAAQESPLDDAAVPVKRVTHESNGVATPPAAVASVVPASATQQNSTPRKAAVLTSSITSVKKDVRTTPRKHRPSPILVQTPSANLTKSAPASQRKTPQKRRPSPIVMDAPDLTKTPSSQKRRPAQKKAEHTPEPDLNESSMTNGSNQSSIRRSARPHKASKKYKDEETY